MEERQISVLLEQAEVQRRLANHKGAIELVQKALAIDPTHAHAHAALAFCLLDARRLPAAGIEIRTALALEGNDTYIHYVAAVVMTAERKLDDAWAHALIALDEGHGDAITHVVAAEIQVLKGDNARAKELLLEALELEADNCDALTELARLELNAGNRAAAEEHIELALKADPSDRDAHVVAGYVALAKGDDAAAEQHARFVLNQESTHEAGLKLFTAVKAKRSPLLGVWWRWNTWVSLRDDRRQIALLIGTFVIARILIIVTDELGYETLSQFLSYGWLGFCAYTWFAPELFRKWLENELGTVKLDPDY
ncbi:MAG: tetratricopeptide repeat protein [Deltaproteobacteria bacterium]|nr:tetratricopeptide repeat protein [Deltaproteobacteria bacterium]